MPTDFPPTYDRGKPVESTLLPREGGVKTGLIRPNAQLWPGQLFGASQAGPRACRAPDALVRVLLSSKISLVDATT